VALGLMGERGLLEFAARLGLLGRLGWLLPEAPTRCQRLNPLRQKL